MNRFLKSLILSTAFLTSMSMAQAADQSRNQQSSRDSDRHEKFGREHKDWKSCYFDERCGCYLYFEAMNRDYYYWCELDNFFYPVSYCPYGTYDFRAGRMSSCPIRQPSKPPVIWGGSPPRGEGGHGPVVPPNPTKPVAGPYHEVGTVSAGVFSNSGPSSPTKPVAGPYHEVGTVSAGVFSNTGPSSPTKPVAGPYHEVGTVSAGIYSNTGPSSPTKPVAGPYHEVGTVSAGLFSNSGTNPAPSPTPKPGTGTGSSSGSRRPQVVTAHRK